MLLFIKYEFLTLYQVHKRFWYKNEKEIEGPFITIFGN